MYHNKIQQELELGNRIFKIIFNGVVKYFSTNINDKCLGLQFKLYCLESGKSYIIIPKNGEEIIRSSTTCCAGCTCIAKRCHPPDAAQSHCGSSPSPPSPSCSNAWISCSMTPTPAPSPAPASPSPAPVPTPTCSDCSNGGYRPNPTPGPGPTPGPTPGPGPKPLDNIILGGWNNCGPPPNTCNTSQSSCVDCVCAPCSNVGKMASNVATGPVGNMGGTGPKNWGPSWSTKWKTPINAILPGKFGNNKIADGDGTYKYKWITVGGEGTSPTGWFKTTEQDIISAKATGCAFDMEGINQTDVKNFVTSMRPLHPEWTYVYVPECGAKISTPAELGFRKNDFIAPMMYYSNFGSYPTPMNINCIKGGGNAAVCLGKDILINGGWLPNQIILTFQSFDAYRTRDNGGTSLLKLLGYLLTENSSYEINGYSGDPPFTLKGPFAGVLGWPAQCGGGGCPCYPPIDEWAIDIVYESYLSGDKPELFNCPSKNEDDSSNDNKCTMVAAINSPDTFKCIDLKQPTPSLYNNS